MQIRSSSRRVVAPATALAAMLVALTASSAWAHPGWDPNEVPAGGPVEVELVVPHACADGGGEPAEGEAESPITEVAIPITDTFRIQPRDVEGFDALVEGDAAIWLASDEGSQTEVRLPALLQVEGAVGDEIPVPVYEECANGEFFRWAATDGESGDPAVVLTIADGTPEPLPSASTVPGPGENPIDDRDDVSPPPPLTAEPSPPATGEPSTADSTSPTATATASPSPSPSSSATPTPSATPSVTATPQASSADGDDGGFNWGLWLPVGVAIAIAVFAAMRFGTDEDEPAEGEPTGDASPPSDGS